MSNFSFSRVEEILSEKRGNSFRLRPLDWATLENWRVKGVPLEAILEGIETVFRQVAENPHAKRGEITLFHCREAVEKAFRQNPSRSAKTSSVVSPNNGENDAEKRRVLDYLDEIAETLKNLECESPLAEAVLRVGMRFGKIKSAFAADESANLEGLEDKLNALDSEFSASLAGILETPQVETARKEVEKHLRPYKNKMTKDIYCETSQTLLLKKLREISGVPRLNLFYLS